MIEKIAALKRQREIALIIIAIILLAIFGVYATRLHLQATRASAAAANAAEEKSLDIKKEGNMISVTVTQLGITFMVPKSLQDLTYITHALPKRNGQTSTAAYFSTASLAKLDSSCTDTKGAIGVLVRTPGTYPKNTKNAVANYGILIKQFTNFYISGAYSSTGCASSSTDIADQVEQKDITTFLDSVISTAQLVTK